MSVCSACNPVLSINNIDNKRIGNWCGGPLDSLLFIQWSIHSFIRRIYHIYLDICVPSCCEGQGPIIILQPGWQSVPQLFNVFIFKNAGVSDQSRKRFVSGLMFIRLHFSIHWRVKLGSDLKKLISKSGKNVWKVTRYKSRQVQENEKWDIKHSQNTYTWK